MEQIPEIRNDELPDCDYCGEKHWCPSEYLDFYCANCGNQIEIDFETGEVL